MARDTVRKTAADTARKAADVGREALREAKSELGSAATQAKDMAMAEVESRAEDGKDRLADHGQRLADRLRSGAGESEGTVQHRLLDILANGVADISEDLRHQKLSSLIEETERFARRNPGVFVAGAALAGFALARFARAGARSGDDGAAEGRHAATTDADGHESDESAALAFLDESEQRPEAGSPERPD